MHPEDSGMDQPPQVRHNEIEAYLAKPDFQRKLEELPDITSEERNYLARHAKGLYTEMKVSTNKEQRLQASARFYDALSLILCDQRERKMAHCPPKAVYNIVFGDKSDCLNYGTGTMGERIYFYPDSHKYSYETGKKGRWMVYPEQSDSVGETGRKYFARFKEAFGSNEVSLDE